MLIEAIEDERFSKSCWK